MRHLLKSSAVAFVVAGRTLPVAAVMLAAPAAAQSVRLSLPALPLAEALQRIQAETGTTVNYDPDAVSGLTSTPVRNARGAEQAARRATSKARIAVRREPDGSVLVTNDILVVAQRDEAETKLLVRDATTSTRTGQSLRDQPRNTQVISSRLIAEQQAQNVADALRNAGGVSVNTATVQGGISYSVRGFGAGGVTNGLPAVSSGSVAIGTTQPVANIERVEVLKGPDALLAGADSLGGTVNIVTKKPSAEELLYLSMETGSFGQVRGTLDANQALNDSRTVSARVIAAAATANRNYGGYRGNEDYLFAPSVRFKNANTDIVAGISLGNQIFGTTPFVPLNPATNAPFDLPLDQPVLRRKDQGIQVETTQFYGEARQTVSDWLTLVARGQHQKLELNIRQYQPFVALNGAGLLLVSNATSAQRGNSDAIDSYAQVKFDTGPFAHRVTGGYTYTENDVRSFSASRSSTFTYNFLTATTLPVALSPTNTVDFNLSSEQSAFYGQYLLKFWKLSLLAGVRRNRFESTLVGFRTSSNSGSKTIPNYGVVLDVTDNLSLFGSLLYGYNATFSIGRDGQKLPDVETRNTEAGVKLDLFGDKMLLNASWFRIRQSNLIITDPTDFLFPIAVPGQQGTGIDLNLSGEIIPGWTVQGSFTRTKYRYLTFSQFGNVVVAQPRDQYSLYSSYRHKIAERTSAGLGAGLFGRSSASVNATGSYYVPPARQVDLNGFLTFGKLDVNLGVRNIFDRRNYNTTFNSVYIPVAEPRNWRLTVGYRFR